MKTKRIEIGKELFACQQGNNLLYIVRIYRGHLFRESWDGGRYHIEPADAADAETARAWGHI